MKRRDLLTGGGLTIGAALLASGQVQGQEQKKRPTQWDESYSGGPLDIKPQSPGLPHKDYTPVVVPNGKTLPFKIVNGVKVIHLIAEKVDHEFASGLMAHCWGYNGLVNGTVIEAVEGDRIRIYVTNKLDVPTSVHWHGIYLPNGMDGVSGVTQRPIRPGETFKYEWTLRQFGTFMYHSHFDTMTQEGMGLTGMFIIHPRNRSEDQKVDRDFVLLMNEYRIEPGTYRPNPNEMTDFNVLTFNGRVFPGTDPLIVKQGQRVRIRFGNLSQMDHHPIHIHGHKFKVTATDGDQIPLSAQMAETTVLVAVGQTRDAEFIADAPGDWIMHCHMTHHMMNQMGHEMPNMIGVDARAIDAKVMPLLPGYMTMGQDGMGSMSGMKMPVPENSIPMASTQLQFSKGTMGGMFTILKVRKQLDNYDDPGWYDNPKGTVADIASPDELRRDGIGV